MTDQAQNPRGTNEQSQPTYWLRRKWLVIWWTLTDKTYRYLGRELRKEKRAKRHA